LASAKPLETKSLLSSVLLHVLERGDTFAGSIANDQPQPMVRKRHEIIAIATECWNLAALCAADHGVAGPTHTLHKPLLDIASKYPVLGIVNYRIVGHHFPTSTRMSVLGEKIDRLGLICRLENLFWGCRERRDGSDYPMKTQARVWQVCASQKENDRG
jgi:hypothetical protein